MLLEKSGEIAPERMKRLSHKGRPYCWWECKFVQSLWRTVRWLNEFEQAPGVGDG